MDKWRGKLAVVVGANSGIGCAIATELLKNGMHVVGLARSEDKFKVFENSMGSLKSKFNYKICDVTNEDETGEAFAWIDSTFGAISVFVYSAGYGNPGFSFEQNISEIRRMFDVNVIGMVIATQHVIKNMRKHRVDGGHLFFMNSWAGQEIPRSGAGFNIMYSASKHAVKIFIEGLRRELIVKDWNIRTTDMSAGLTKTPMTAHITDGSVEFATKYKALLPKDIADACIAALSLPINARMVKMIMKPANEW